MRLDYLCDMDLFYRKESYGEFVLVRPYGTEEGSGYGEGDGKVNGEKLRGSVRWVNHPRRRGDRTMLPDAHGLIRTDDAADILFALQGRTGWVEAGGRRRGRQVLATLFETQDERYQWLNDVVCVLEGEIDPESGRMHSRIYACVNELV